MHLFKQVEKDIHLLVRVKTSQITNRIKVEGEQIIIRVKTPPVKGKANKTIIKMTKKLFNRDVAIISGLTSTKKTLLVKDIDINEALERLVKNIESEK